MAKVIVKGFGNISIDGVTQEPVVVCESVLIDDTTDKIYVEDVKVGVLKGDSLAQMRTKIKNECIVWGQTLGYTLASGDVLVPDFA